MGPILVALMMLFAVLAMLLAAAVLLFQMACVLAGVPRPTFGKATGIVAITFVVLTLVEGMMAASVRLAYGELNLPLWEAGVVAFFLGLPIDLVLASGIHALFLGLKFNKSVEVWFAHRLILLGIVLFIAGVAAVGFLASNR